MNPADPNPKLNPEEQAFVEAQRSRVRPAAAPEDFAARLRNNGPPALATDKIVPMAGERPRRIAFGFAAAAAVALAWLALHFIESDPDQLPISENTTPLDTDKKKDLFPLPESLIGKTASEPPAGALVAMEQLLTVHKVAVIRRDHGLPPVQLLAVDGMRVIQDGDGRKLEVETRFVPVALKYH